MDRLYIKWYNDNDKIYKFYYHTMGKKHLKYLIDKNLSDWVICVL